MHSFGAFRLQRAGFTSGHDLDSGLIIIIIIIILTAIGLAPGGSSPVHIYREHCIEYTNNAQNT